MTTRETFAVEQIEITKGPSSTFAGRGAEGGAVNSITKQASTDYDFTKVDLGVGTDDYYRGTVDANFRLSDYAAVRVNGLYASDEVPNRNFSDRERWGVAASALFAPTDTVRLLVDYYHLSADDLPDLGGYMPRPTGTRPGDVTVYEPWHDVPNYAQSEDFLESDVDTVTARLTWEAGPNITLMNSARYGETQNGYVVTGLRGGAYNAASGTYAPLTLSSHQGYQDVSYFVNQFNALGKLYTGELYHQLILGAEYSDYEVSNGVFTLTPTGAPNCTTGTATTPNAWCITDANRNVLFDDDGIHDILQRDIARGPRDSEWNVETWSLYLMDTVDVNDWLTVNGGVRVDSFDYSNAVGTTNVQTYEYGDTLWNGHAGITVKPHEEGIVYLTWGTAKNINGGESDLGGNCGYGGVCVPNDPSYQIGDGSAESTESWELGTKWDLFDDRFLVTGALFQITKDGVFETAGTGYEPGGSLNTGSNRVRGVEVGVVGNITDQLMAQVTGTIMDSEILESNVPAREGLKLSNFSEEQFFGQLRYQATEAFAVGVSATYKGEMFAGQPDTAASYDPLLEVYTYRVPDYWTFDAFATYRINGALQARLNVTNIGNEDYYLAGYQSGHFLYKGDERRATLTLTGRF
jgi:catecholate siderophore receptor